MFDSKELYAILGVLPDAEPVVISAAYRALAARYHPDRWEGPPEIAHTRMAEINVAYEVLGNSQRREAYDKERRSSHGSFDSRMDEADQAFSQALGELEDRWNVAASVFPELDGMRKRLSKTSHQLAFAFVTQLLESKKFNIAREIANHMESSWRDSSVMTNRSSCSLASLFP
jgi:curved DNA-binding protein CbpA